MDRGIGMDLHVEVGEGEDGAGGRAGEGHELCLHRHGRGQRLSHDYPIVGVSLEYSSVCRRF